jgi:hypothetical protein
MSTAIISARSTVRATRVQTSDAQASTVRTRLRLTRRGRVVLTLLAAIPVVLGIAFGVLNGGQASAGDATHAAVHFQHVTVEPGESLWQVAQQEAPKADPRQFVEDVVSLNNLPSSAVQAGQRLAIPTKYTSAH